MTGGLKGISAKKIRPLSSLQQVTFKTSNLQWRYEQKSNIMRTYVFSLFSL